MTVTRIKVIAGSWQDSSGKLLREHSETAYLVQLDSSYKKVVLKKNQVEILPKEKVVLATRHIGALDFSNPYTTDED